MPFANFAGAQTNAGARVYPSGAKVALSIAGDLYATLEPRFQRTLNPQTIEMAQTGTPMIGSTQSQGCFRRQVFVTQGFIDLLNHIAHAKAIDEVEPGYFREYVSELALSGDESAPPAPRRLDDPKYWTDSIMNKQASLFNQMVSMTVAVNLSHHYLDHYAKYASQMPGGKIEPINNFIDAKEWEASVRCATENSLDCALATEGAKTLFDCIDQMSRRPAWAAYIVPPSVNIKKLDHELWRYEHDFFHGAPQQGRPALGG